MKKMIMEKMRLQLEERDLFEQAKSYAFDYIDQLPDRTVFPTEEAIINLNAFDESFPEESCEPTEGATLKFLGRGGVEELVNALCDRAKQFAEELDAEGFQILNDVVFNQVLVSCDTPAETQSTLQNIQKGGECWCGGTAWEGKPAIRVSVCSWATTVEDVHHSVASFVKARQRARSAKTGQS